MAFLYWHMVLQVVTRWRNEGGSCGLSKLDEICQAKLDFNLLRDKEMEGELIIFGRRPDSQS